MGIVGDPKTITKAMTDIVSSIGPTSAAETFKGPIEGLTKSKGAAGILLIVGILSALWTASGYVGAFMRASNEIYEVEEGRSFIKLRPLQMLVTLALILLLALVLLALVLTGPVAEQVGSAIGVGSAAVTIWDIAKWPVLLAVVLIMIALLYYAAPNVKLRGFKWVSPGSMLAIVVWLVASAAFAFYVSNFGSYDKTYGALGGVVVFLVWLWITNVAILLGAELNAERERSIELEEGTPGAEREIQLELPLRAQGEEAVQDGVSAGLVAAPETKSTAAIERSCAGVPRPSQPRAQSARGRAQRGRDRIERGALLALLHADAEAAAVFRDVEAEERAARALDRERLLEQRAVETGIEVHGQHVVAAIEASDAARQPPVALELAPQPAFVEGAARHQ